MTRRKQFPPGNNSLSANRTSRRAEVHDRADEVPDLVDEWGIRWGLCCQFIQQPIRFRTTTAAHLQQLRPHARKTKLAELCRENARSLFQAMSYCIDHGIGCFRVIGTLCPVKTHPQFGYQLEDLPDADPILAMFRACGELASANGLRTVLHPDQFVVLNSPRAEVLAKSIEDLAYHAQIAEWVGADVINIHGGGAYGDKTSSLERLERNIEQLSPSIRSRLTLENDDRVYTPADLLPLCQRLGVPFLYDVHHHRCLPDGLSIEEATGAARRTWNREQVVHLSSPWAGWSGPQPSRHHRHIDPGDFPDCWRGLGLTVEVEAKDKELAIARLRAELKRRFAHRPVNRKPHRAVL